MRTYVEIAQVWDKDAQRLFDINKKANYTIYTGPLYSNNRYEYHYLILNNSAPYVAPGAKFKSIPDGTYVFDKDENGKLTGIRRIIL